MSVMRRMRRRRSGQRLAQPASPAERPWQVLRYRVQPALAPGMATADPEQRQIASPRSAMPLERLERIGRAGRLKTARVAEPRAEQVAIPAHQPHEQHPRQVEQASDHVGPFETTWVRPGDASTQRATSDASSMRTASRKALDAALGNRLRSKPARSRTTHSPPGSAALRAPTAARISRRSRLRVTARRAWRFGTTKPSQMLAGTPESASSGRSDGAGPRKSSTVSTQNGASAVDNSGPTGSRQRFPGRLGIAATW